MGYLWQGIPGIFQLSRLHFMAPVHQHQFRPPSDNITLLFPVPDQAAHLCASLIHALVFHIGTRSAAGTPLAHGLEGAGAAVCQCAPVHAALPRTSVSGWPD
jgi:hypothetical protein